MFGLVDGNNFYASCERVFQPELIGKPVFSGANPRSKALMDTLDKANQKFGRGTVGFASSGWKPKPMWAMNQKGLSPAYTSRWDQLLRVS